MPQLNEKFDKSEHLSPSEHELLTSAFPAKSWSMCTTIAQVLQGINGEWQLLDSGILCFVKDREKKSFFLRLYDPESLQICWEMELYLEICLENPKPYFLTFDGDRTRIGINFHAASDSVRMNDIINEKVCRRQNSVKKRNSKLAFNQRNSRITAQQNATSKMDYMKNMVGKVGSKFMELPDIQVLHKARDIPSDQIMRDHRAQQKHNRNKKYNIPHNITKSDIGMPTEFKVVGGYNCEVERSKKNANSGTQRHRHTNRNYVDTLPSNMQNPEDLKKWMINVYQDDAIKELLRNADISEADMLKGSNAAVVYDFVTKKGVKTIQRDYRNNSVRQNTKLTRPSVAPPPIPTSKKKNPPPIPPSKHRPNVIRSNMNLNVGPPVAPPISGIIQQRPGPPMAPPIGGLIPKHGGGPPIAPPMAPPIGVSKTNNIQAPAVDLMAQIRKTGGTSGFNFNENNDSSLNQVSKPVQAGPADLFAQIRNTGGTSGFKFNDSKTRSDSIQSESPVIASSNPLADQLKSKLAEARQWMSDDSSSDDVDSEEWDSPDE